MKKKSLSLLLALALSLGLAVPAMAAENGFTDVDPNGYCAEAVAWAVENNITSGTSATTFSPAQNCTVAQIVTFLWRANGSPRPTGEAPFSDVNTGDWFYDAACWTGEKGIVTGESFNPNAPCTRLMAVRYMWEAAYRPWGLYKTGFSDVGSPEGDDKDNKAVSWAVKWGITSGTSETAFSPQAICTRGQIVTFLHRCTQNFQPAGTPLTDESKMAGAYVKEGDPDHTLTVELSSNGIKFQLKKPLAYVKGGLNIVPGTYGGLGAIWNGLEMQFYEEDFVVVTVPESVSPTYAGKYVRQTS